MVGFVAGMKQEVFVLSVVVVRTALLCAEGLIAGSGPWGLGHLRILNHLRQYTQQALAKTSRRCHHR